ncbi:MAG: UDP-N-acetylmuramoyl-L-alanyl-D-glutamate--2,6-diaminopimelate ligase [Streptosporangiaceae bacterium]
MRPRAAVPRPLSGLAALLGVAHAVDPAGWAHGTVTGMTHDSRAVSKGDLYAALPGNRVHGADFAAEAVDAGAVAVLTDPAGRGRMGQVAVPVFVVDDPRGRLGEAAAWVYGQPTRDMLVIGVTGTSGKTTTAHLVDSGLRAAGHRTGLLGTVEIKIGDDVLPSGLTTPEATDLQGVLAVMRDEGVTAVAMEVSSHALALHRVRGTAYDVAVFTNLSQDHLDFHADLDDYFAAKARLFTPAYAQVAVVNVDNGYGRILAERRQVPTTTYSAAGRDGADWRALDVRLGVDGSAFRLVGPGGVEADASVQVPGRFNVDNALAAVVALVEGGVSLPAAVLGVGALPGVPGRMERVEAGQDFAALVDYSHKPAAVEAVLRSLRPLVEGRLIVVLGCGGDRDRGKRPMMGAAAARLADTAVFTTDNPRSEDPMAILSAMYAGAADVPSERRGHVVVEPDRAAAIALAVSRASRGDLVVVAGKGHERGQEIRGVVYPFDDRMMLREAVRAACVGGST